MCRLLLLFLLLCATPQVAQAQVFRVDSDTDFEIGNSGSSDYLFNWSTFVNEVDPTLELVAGNTYTFRRTSGSHPFVITDDSLPVSGTDGSFFRTTTSGAVIDAATLTPLADFTADPAPTSDLITWSPTESDVGDYFYTCRVVGHTGMTGAIRIVSAVPEPSSAAMLIGVAGCCLLRRRKS